jgi:hypothetical protein
MIISFSDEPAGDDNPRREDTAAKLETLAFLGLRCFRL